MSVSSERVPPHNIEAEQSILGGILLDNDILPGVLGILHGDELYRAAHRTIFAGIRQLSEANEPIDIVTLTNLLKSQNRLDEVGGYSYVSSLVDNVPGAANVIHYAGIVKEKAARRRLLSLSRQVAEFAFNEDHPVEDIISEVSKELNAVQHRKEPAFRPYSELIREAVKRIEDRQKNPKHVSGVPTPWKQVNALTNGLQRSELIVLAGRPSMGKTAMAQQCATHAAEEVGTVLVFSLEMSGDALTERALSSGSNIASQRIRTGRLGPEDWKRLIATANVAHDLPILVNDSADLTSQQIRLLCRQERLRSGDLALVVIDYLSLVSEPDNGHRQRYLEVGEITRTFKAMAKELEAPVLLLAQLNRSCEARDDKRPLLSDLRESGDIEQNADLVMFVYRPEYYCQTCRGKSPCSFNHRGKSELIVAKQRNGPTGKVPLTWVHNVTRFENAANES
jgi:replicative DNA helicase